MEYVVTAVSRSTEHTFSKANQPFIKLIAGIGVEGDAHAGSTVKHRYLVDKNPNKPNLRQVHLIQSELFDEINRKGFTLDSGELGENITTRGIDLVALPTETRLLIGDAAIVELTALRNPCVQIDDFQPGLLKETLYRDDKGNPSLKRGVMGIVVVGGIIYPGDSIVVNLPSKPHSHLEYVW
jgi:MOSC domain-containing protein YiiM